MNFGDETVTCRHRRIPQPSMEPVSSNRSCHAPRRGLTTGQQMHLIQRPLFLESGLPPERRIALVAERRQFLKRRWRGIADDGTEFGFDLETRLIDGCVILQQNGNDYLVRQLPETVYEIVLETPAHAALVAWKVGNLHLPAQILDHSIRILHDEAMTQLLEREGWPYAEPEVVFTPMKAMAHTP